MEYTWRECIFLNDNKAIKEYFKNHKNSMFILGQGFDPRTCEGIGMFYHLDSEIKVFLIDYSDKSDNSSNVKSASENLKKIQGMIPHNQLNIIKVKNIKHFSEEVKKELNKEKIKGFDNILIDVSAMPREISYVLIKRLLALRSGNQKIYVFVCENSALDDSIEPIIDKMDTVEFMHGFNSFSMGMETISDAITVWIPILGYNELSAFKKISDALEPDEICPVIPFPGLNANRGEKIIRYYGDYIFKTLEVDKRNIMYIPERYPLLGYEKLCKTVEYYKNAIAPDNDNDTSVRFVFSTQSSKLIDIGILLAIMDLQKQGYLVGIMTLEYEGYRFEGNYDIKQNKLCCLCLNDREFEW